MPVGKPREKTLRRIPFSEVRFIVLVVLLQSLQELNTIFTQNVPDPLRRSCGLKENNKDIC